MKNFQGANAFVCIPAFDSVGKHDVTGAFRPESAALVKTLGLHATVRIFDNNRALPDRRREVGVVLERVSDLDLVAFVCHGWRDGIQAGWTNANVQDLADRLTLACKSNATVALYACDTARDTDGDRKDDVGVGPGGKGGFASSLFLGMVKRGWRGQLWAHPTTAHCTMNPYLRTWRQDEEPELGDFAVEPHSGDWAAWRTAMQGPLRFRVLECETEAEIVARLRAG